MSKRLAAAVARLCACALVTGARAPVTAAATPPARSSSRMSNDDKDATVARMLKERNGSQRVDR